jgi:hypothetical protein
MLDNNSESMKTIVETFIIEETAELIYDNEKLEQWNKYINDLNLEGQTKLTKPEKSPIPFLFMKTSMVRMFKTLCPRIVDIQEYDVTPIPLEILSLVSLSQKEKYFNKIEIWYDDSLPDPVCVGKTCEFYGYESGYTKRTENLKTKEEVVAIIGPANSVYETDEKHYLLGKWADVKRDFKELKQMAIDRYIEETRTNLESNIKRYENELQDIQITAKNYFA